MADSSEQQGATCEERVASNLKDCPTMTSNQGQGQKRGGGDSCHTPPLKMSSPRVPGSSGLADDQSTDTKLSGDSGGAMSAAALISPRHKDPDRIKKDREREERVRQARERLEEERKKKLIELHEQQRQAEENREKQLELRRKRIEDLRRRETERRAEVERRRRERDTVEKNRRETLLLKAEERVARYEAWKRGGQKGGRGHVLGFGSATPRNICQPQDRTRRSSSSHSALLRHSPSDSDSDYSFRPQRRALSACSTVPRHCCVDLNRSGPPPGCAMSANKQLSVSTSVLCHKRHTDFSSSGALNAAHRPDSLLALNSIPEGRRSVLAPATRHRSVMSLSAPGGGTVRPREGKSPRKPRPASVAGTMPSIVGADSSKSAAAAAAPPRSHSTDRLARDRPRPRGAASASRAEDKDLEEKKTPDKAGVKMSRKTLDRLSTPRQVPDHSKDTAALSTPKRETNIVRTSPRKAYSTSNLAMPRQKPSLREKTPKEAAAAASKPQQQTPKTLKAHKPKDATPGAKTLRPTTPSAPSPLTVDPTAATPTRTPERLLSPTPGADEDGGSRTAQARSTPTPLEKPGVESSQPRDSPTPADKPAAETPQAQSTPLPVDRSAAEASPSRSTPTPMEKSTGDLTAEEYKARLAEKRRQAREKAERGAEEERKRKEEEERLEEERQREEEEEEKRREEESLRLAEDARKVEEERLRKAIEVEDARKAEESARLEQERLAKEEAERKAKEEAERLEQEKQEKARRDEEERLERKKRLEMIMKRVKTDNTGEGGKDTPRSVGSSPVRTTTTTTTNAAAANRDSSPSEPDPKALLNAPTQPDPEERKRSVDSSADESRTPPSGALSPADAPSPVPDPTLSLSQSSSQENVLDVKEDSTPASSRSESPVISVSTTPRGSASEAGGSDKPKFKSPLLQKLVEGRDDASSPGEGPKFKSPLLQNLLSKTRVGARMGLTQDYSRSSPDLSQGDHGGSGSRSGTASPTPTPMAMSASMIDMDTASPAPKEGLSKMSISMIDIDTVSSAPKEGLSKMSASLTDMHSVNSASKEELNSNEEKEVDTSEGTPSSSSHSSPSHRNTLTFNGEGVTVTPTVSESELSGSTAAHTSVAPDAVTVDSAVSWGAQDSGVSLGDELQSPVSLNGHAAPVASQQQQQDLVDSSISLQSVDGSDPPLTESGAGGQHSSEDKTFEELIDLSALNNSTPTPSPLLNNADDLVTFHHMHDEGSGVSPPPPIIAFEESSKMKHQDVSDLLS
ncbi:hypothetical protein ACOMHN_025522 [Nucella lapillus]